MSPDKHGKILPGPIKLIAPVTPEQILSFSIKGLFQERNSMH